MDMKAILKEKKLTALYQPIYMLKNKEIYGYEGLSRVNASGVSNIMDVIEFAEKTNKVQELDLLMMEEVIRSFKGKGILFVNMMVKNLEETQEYLEKMVKVAGEANVFLENIIIELSERKGWDLSSLNLIKEFRKKYKFRLAIDDFGSGFANCRLLLVAHPDIVKIDRAIVMKVHESREKQIIIRGFIRMLKEIGIEVLCEGIEERIELELLEDFGSDYGQGYYLGRPA